DHDQRRTNHGGQALGDFGAAAGHIGDGRQPAVPRATVWLVAVWLVAVWLVAVSRADGPLSERPLLIRRHSFHLGGGIHLPSWFPVVIRSRWFSIDAVRRLVKGLDFLYR